MPARQTVTRGANMAKTCAVQFAGLPRSFAAVWTILMLLTSGTVQAEGVLGSGPVRSLLEQRFESVIQQKWDISCGAAALATLLTFQLGDRVSEREVAQGMLRRTDPLKV